MGIIGIVFDILSFVAVLWVCLKYSRLRRIRYNEYYTDYVNGNIVFRVYKLEFGYQALKDLPTSKILDSGHLSVNYDWVLFEK